MWTEITRSKYERKGLGYSSDLSDAEWAMIEPRLPQRSRLGRPPKTEMRSVVNALLYMVRTGCQWRQLPREFPPYTTCSIISTLGVTAACCNQAVNAVRSQDGSELGTAGCNLADRAVEVNVGDLPGAAVAAHNVVDLDRLPIGFDDLAAHHHPGWRGLLTSYLQPLSVIAVEAVGINRRDVASEALGNLLARRLA